MSSAGKSAAVRNELRAMAAMAGRELNEFAWNMISRDLAAFTPEQVLVAIAKFRQLSKGFPAVSEIIALIPGQHPSFEEAWLLIPQSEDDTTVWTDEISKAYSAVRDELRRDPVAARFGFRSIYERLVADARAAGRMPKWIPSLGFDSLKRTRAIQEAVQMGRITEGEATRYLPEWQGPSEPTDPAGQKRVQALLSGVTQVIPEERTLDPVEEARKIKQRIAQLNPEGSDAEELK